MKSRFADDDPPPPYFDPEVKWQHLVGIDYPRLFIVQPLNSWTAVVRGAVLRGLESAELVRSRKARYHYGILVTHVFDPKRHSLENKYYEHYEDVDKAKNQIHWHVRKDQDLPSDEPICLPVYCCHDLGSSHPVTVSIVISDEEHEPTEFVESLKTRTLGVLDICFDDIPQHYWKVGGSKHGVRYRKLYVKVGMTFQSGAICFDLRIDNTVYGEVRFDFE